MHDSEEGMSIHINWGHSARKSEKGDNCCFYCSKREDRMAYTYFGAPVCGECWDTKWLLTEDGATDSPFDEIKHWQSGEWIG